MRCTQTTLDQSCTARTDPGERNTNSAYDREQRFGGNVRHTQVLLTTCTSVQLDRSTIGSMPNRKLARPVRRESQYNTPTTLLPMTESNRLYVYCAPLEKRPKTPHHRSSTHVSPKARSHYWIHSAVMTRDQQIRPDGFFPAQKQTNGYRQTPAYQQGSRWSSALLELEKHPQQVRDLQTGWHLRPSSRWKLREAVP